MVMRMFHGLSAVVPLGLPEEEPGLPAESGGVLSLLLLLFPNWVVG
jgi:hypothetical protein